MYTPTPYTPTPYSNVQQLLTAYAMANTLWCTTSLTDCLLIKGYGQQKTLNLFVDVSR